MTTFTCTSLGTGQVVYLRDVVHRGGTRRPDGQHIPAAFTSVGDNPGELVMETVTAGVPVWVTVEVGPFVRRIDATVAYDGTMVLASGELVVADASNTAGEQVPFRLQPGVHWVIAQVSGREVAKVPHPEPVEHWYITFVDAEVVTE
jgi:hypothetical protein